MTAYVCRTCSTTGQENFYQTARYQCKACWNRRTYQSGKDKINKLKQDRGGACERCGFDQHLSALQWHHPDPTVKEYTIGHRRGLAVSKLKEEVDKCQLLCANCHAIEHAD